MATTPEPATAARDRRTTPSGPGLARVRRPYYEFQYHSSDIRRGVRYLFLTRRQGLWLVAAAIAWLLFVVHSLNVAPAVIGDYFAEREYQQLLEERSRAGEELKETVQRLAELESAADAVRLEMLQIYLVYGFSEDASLGKGGYPHEPAKVPTASIYAGEIRAGNGLMARISEQMGVLEAFLTEVRSFEAAHRDQVRTTPSISPLSGKFVLTSPFGTRISPFTKEVDFHAGLDLAAPIGDEIKAPADGVVAFAGRYPLRRSVGWWRYGNLVAMRNGDRFITLFGHCKDVLVTTGQKVQQGDVIATVGDTGWSTNPHLHYEIRRLEDDGEFKPVDPRIYILDHRWSPEDKFLVRGRQSPSADSYEPLPRILGR
jgi:murein DD-endopeptidase MepM/ murein hydrolase activator NlpD